MGARQQGRISVQQTIQVVDELTLILGSVEMEPIGSLRALVEPLQRLTTCVGLLASASQDPRELGPLQSVRKQLGPLIQLVAEPDVVAPPFSPDMRQRIGYSTAQLLGLRARLQDQPPRIPGKALRNEADALLVGLTDSWKAFRTDPSLERLEDFEQNAVFLSNFYFAIGLPDSEIRVKRTRRLCELLTQASDRNGDLDDVPALLREVTDTANELCRPTLAEHREWLKSLVA